MTFTEFEKNVTETIGDQAALLLGPLIIYHQTACISVSNKTVETDRYHLVQRGFIVAVVNPVGTITRSGADVPPHGS